MFKTEIHKHTRHRQQNKKNNETKHKKKKKKKKKQQIKKKTGRQIVFVQRRVSSAGECFHTPVPAVLPAPHPHLEG